MKIIRKKKQTTGGLVEGERATVTGDSGLTGHEFTNGTEVTLTSLGQDGIWRCDGADDYWWVDPVDLEPVIKPPTDKEMKAVLKSIQQSAKNSRGTR